MTIPNFQTLMLPLLKLAGDRLEHSFKDAIPFLAEKFDLTENEQRELLPSGKQSKFNKRVYLTKTHLFKAGLLNSDRRGAFEITEEGLRVLATNPQLINTKFLERYDTYCEFRTPAKQKEKHVLAQTMSANWEISKTTPEQILEHAYQQLQAALSIEVLKAIEQCSPSRFKSLVIDLLVSMGYGDSPTQIGQTLKRSPEAINGTIEVERSSETIYIESIRHKNTVTKAEIQKFAGVLWEQNANQGIFITTSNFSQRAIDYANRIDSKIILIDGNRLAELTFEHNVGITPIFKYEVKQVDSNYFR